MNEWTDLRQLILNEKKMENGTAGAGADGVGVEWCGGMDAVRTILYC